ncbi:site-specific DNA-methyltransferase [Mucilaginibacter hurinus]|uniref:site-specific DNA-methyltransferase n=1 Tax=Mucilaginibacter hurinus TaxID=2201324 RepID=UPI002936DEF7|nr:site-specific DNA-methyltransferase [Mucilaginibacter hurinus]
MAKEGGVKLKNGKKPEKLIKQILEVATEEGDLVVDYHLGSGTTCAVAHKMKRQYIGIEQLNYGENDSTKRLINVISGDQSGISKAINWQGGGSFIYCELKKDNQIYIDRIQDAVSKDDLISIWKDMDNNASLSYQFDKKTLNERLTAFKTAPIDNMKKYLLELLDKNQLYVNYSEIDDSQHKISESDKKLNKQFYSTKR